MIIEVVIPSIRQVSVDRLLYSLANNRRKPDLVTVISNEVGTLPSHGLNARVLRFSSEEYPYGANDVALRRNIGIWESEADVVLFQDDDQIAPPGMIGAVEAYLWQSPFVWGHHRFIDFETLTADEIMVLEPEAGRSREHPANSYHSYLSCYAGMMAAPRELLLELQGFDLLFLGRHGSEDQNLGHRMLRRFAMEKVFIPEPPFAWHPLKSPRRLSSPITNLCDEPHQLDYVTTNGVLFQICQRCPLSVCVDKSQVFFTGQVVLPYDHSLVQVTKEKL